MIETTFSITPFFLLIFYVLLIIYLIFSVIFYYHWQSYATDQKVTTQTYIAYAIVSLPLLIIMGLSLFFI
jgi:hypothetical protein